MPKSLVLYHANCFDGYTSAWCAWLKLGDTAEYQAINYGEAPPAMDDRDVYILDFSFPRDVLERLSQRAKSIVVLDHHKTAIFDLTREYHPGLTDIDEACKALGPIQIINRFGLGNRVLSVFCLDKSGARLAWEHFHGEREESPALVDYVEDRDLWTHKLPSSKAVNSYIRTHQFDFITWNRIANKLTTDDGLHEFKLKGAAILDNTEAATEALCKHAYTAVVDGHDVPCLNTSCLISEIGHRLCQGKPFSVTWFYDGQANLFRYSLRSSAEGLDVSAIAKRFGGGGHRNAAGFESKEMLACKL